MMHGVHTRAEKGSAFSSRNSEGITLKPRDDKEEAGHCGIPDFFSMTALRNNPFHSTTLMSIYFWLAILHYSSAFSVFKQHMYCLVHFSVQVYSAEFSMFP